MDDEGRDPFEKYQNYKRMTRLLDQHGNPAGGDVKTPDCDHGVTFDEQAAKGLSSYEVRKRWPRGHGPCPKGCGFNGIAYASYLHYLSGDW